MANTSTKAIATRLPLEDYVKVIRTAVDLKLSISDYVLLKLHTSDDDLAVREELRKVNSELAKTKRDLEEIRVKFESLQRQQPAENGSQRREALPKLARKKDVHPAMLPNEDPIIFTGGLRELRKYLDGSGMEEHLEGVVDLNLGHKLQWDKVVDINLDRRLQYTLELRGTNDFVLTKS